MNIDPKYYDRLNPDQQELLKKLGDLIKEYETKLTKTISVDLKFQGDYKIYSWDGIKF